MLKIIASTIIKRSQPFFLFHRKARTNDIPTQAATLLPFNINYLHDNPGSRRYSKIVGRGPSSGKGKTCGRGVKGHKSRSGGGVPPKFEGGQSILARRLPKFGARRQNFDRYNYINIGSIIYYIKRGILNPAQTITIKSLVDVGLVKKVKFGVKLLSKGIDQLNVPLHFELSDASRLIIQKVKALGGSIKCVYRTPLLLKAHLKPQRFPLPLEDPIPIVRHVQKLSKLEQRGAQVVYKKPEWKIKQESQIKVQKKQYPADRSPGVGANKIRKRKQKIYKVINYNLP